MLRYFLHLLIYIPVQLFAYLVTPLLPLFAVKRMGWCDNRSYESVEWRLPLWLAWFDTPDNCLFGDANWAANHSEGYLDMVGWLYRNSLYGFKWSVLAAPNNPKVCTVIEGNTNLNHHTKTYGVMRITRTDGYWQYKSVKPSKVFKGRIWVLNFGWLLDDPSQERALFMCSPRLK
jgi:hypothetical protein